MLNENGDGLGAVSASNGEGNSMPKWRCQICGFVYDEAVGAPEEGIPAGKRWPDVRADWTCPDCGADIASFDMQPMA